MRAWLKRYIGEIDLRLPQRRDADLLFYACAFMVAACLILGGATRSGFLSDVILAFLAIPLLALGVWRLFDTDVTGRMRWALWFCAALVVTPLLQLVPIPSSLWALLPHREMSAGSFALIGEDVPWMPMSVSPEATWLSALSLLPPLSLFVGILLLGYRERRWLSLVILAVGLISVFLGLLQVAQGPTSPLRFFQFTNLNDAVGFFANRNHFAALIYALVLIASAWAVNAGAAAASSWSRREFDTASTIAAVGCFTLLVLLLAAQAVARSRAGMGLTIVALLGAFALGASNQRDTAEASATRRLLFAAIAIAIVLTVQFALYRILQRFGEDPVDDARWIFLRNTSHAVLAYLPFGAGVGTFVPVYHLFERPQDVLANWYITRAHNDVVEALMETGIFGLALMVWFVGWLGRRALEVWRTTPPSTANPIDWSLVKASSLIPPLLIANSLVEYPLRTSAIMAIAAFACALLIEPPPSALRQHSDARERAPERSSRRPKSFLLPPSRWRPRRLRT